jgi:hypothetical protein
MQCSREGSRRRLAREAFAWRKRVDALHSMGMPDDGSNNELCFAAVAREIRHVSHYARLGIFAQLMMQKASEIPLIFSSKQLLNLSQVKNKKIFVFLSHLVQHILS